VYKSAGIPLIRSMNVHFAGFRRKGLVFIGDEEAAQLDHVTVQPDDVLFNITGASIGRVTTAPADMAGARVNQHVCILRTKDALVPQFLAYYMATPAQQAAVSSNQTGGTRQAVTKAMLLDWPVPLPAPKEQRRIVELLEQADGLRRKRTEADALADRILPALFRKMFGDPATNPKGWPSKPLARAVQMVSGGTPSKANPEFWSGSIPWVSPKDMKCLVIRDTEDHITKEAVENSATSLISDGSAMIVVRSGILVHSVPVAIAGRAMTITQDLKGLIPNRDEVEPYYLLAWLLASKQTLLGCVKRGATVHSIDSDRFQSLLFILPPTPVQESFARRFKVLLDMQARQVAAGMSIETLFATMLHRAFSGQLTTKWREAHLKELLAEMEQQARLLNAPQEGKASG
jgi:type I restriction enzyme S subunit